MWQDHFRGLDTCGLIPSSILVAILVAIWPWVDANDGAGIILESLASKQVAFMPTFPYLLQDELTCLDLCGAPTKHIECPLCALD